MDIITAIKTRRSIRNYTDQAIDLQQIQECLQLAIHAPSAHNQQAWKFFILTQKEDFARLWELMEYGKMIPEAHIVVLAAFDTRLLRAEEFIQQDMWATLQTFLLALHAQGLGACRVGLYPHEKEMRSIHQYFQLEEAVVPFALVPIGIPALEPREKRLKTDWKIQIL